MSDTVCAALVESEPRLSDETRDHLGALLAAAYARSNVLGDHPKPLADLLARLAEVLDAADAREADDFRRGLLEAAPSLYRFATSLLRRHDGADDLVQDTLVRALRGRANFHMGTNLSAWLFTIMRNQFYSQCRKLAPEVADTDGTLTDRLVSVPEQAGHLDLQDLQVALAKLPDVMRESLMLVTVENMSYEEAAAVMNCRIGTVKSRVWRAREQLAVLLGYDGSEIGNDGLTLSAMGGAGSTFA